MSIFKKQNGDIDWENIWVPVTTGSSIGTETKTNV